VDVDYVDFKAGAGEVTGKFAADQARADDGDRPLKPTGFFCAPH